MADEVDAAGTAWERPRAGKRVATWEQTVQVPGVQRPVRRVLRLVERTIGSRGQHLILPEYELDGWTTTLPARIDAQQVIALYAEHGTHEQFHAEFKTDMDLTRLPSGKFDTNALVCRLAALAMNILRLMGQRGLLGPDAPVRHQAKRRRIKTVMQELILPRGPVDRAWPADAARHWVPTTAPRRYSCDCTRSSPPRRSGVNGPRRSGVEHPVRALANRVQNSLSMATARPDRAASRLVSTRTQARARQ
jgi:hypothetical protein